MYIDKVLINVKERRNNIKTTKNGMVMFGKKYKILSEYEILLFLGLFHKDVPTTYVI